MSNPLTASAFSIATKTYRCDRGHEITGHFDWMTLSVAPGNGGPRSAYNFCPFCWGEYAVKQWPLHEVEASAELPDRTDAEAGEVAR